MEIQTTETSENSASLPVISTETTETNETLDQTTQPVIAQPQTTETSEQSPSPVTTMPETEAPLPEVTNTQTSESLEETHTQTPLPEITNTHATEPSDDSTPPPVTNTQTTEILDQSTLSPLKETNTTETMEPLVIPPVVTDNSHDNLVASPENHQVIEMRHETAEEAEEVRSILRAIAATGKFCHDWEKLRNMLSLHLKQVISEYPQARMTIQEQKASLGETHAELVKRLDDALHSFVDGPPFTIQRLSEIILDARHLYPNLSKLALALEKNLSVTSTLTMLTVPNPPSLTTTPNGVDKATEGSNSIPNPNSNPIPVPNPQVESDSVMENGAQPVAAADRDEIMTEVEADVSDVMTMDMETYEKPSEESTPMMTTGDS